MDQELKELINRVDKLSVYADENKYHPSVVNKLTTIYLQLKEIRNNERTNNEYNKTKMYKLSRK